MAQNKNGQQRMPSVIPAGARFLAGFCGWWPQAHCVTSTVKLYDQLILRANYAHTTSSLSMKQDANFVQKSLYIFTV